MNKKQLSVLTERVRNAHITLDVGDRHALVSILEEFAQELDEGEMTAPEALASSLIDVWIAEHNRQIPWATAVQIIAIVTKESDEMRDELLGFGDPSTPTSESIAKEIHYPACWDTAAFPTLDDAVLETVVSTRFVCSECSPAEYEAGLHNGSPALTDEQILALAKKYIPSYEWEGSILDFARALLGIDLAESKE